MEEILGVHNDDHEFDRFLMQWADILVSRTEQATDAIGRIDGVEGLILAGSNGAGHPWPLSDIDLIPIYDDAKKYTASEAVENARLSLLAEWSCQGWRTGVDVGRLLFTRHELETVFTVDDPDPLPLLEDDRWYHSIDKAYGGRALIDSDGMAQRLSSWFTRQRFSLPVVSARTRRTLNESRASLALMDVESGDGNRVGAFMALLKSIQWYQIYLMEQWGERDNSLGRFGTRFEQTAQAHQSMDIVDTLHEISSLTPELVCSRLKQAPWWVQERRDRSWKARRSVDEPVTALQNDRDVLRVCTSYELRLIPNSPFPEWLVIPSEEDLHERKTVMGVLLKRHECTEFSI